MPKIFPWWCMFGIIAASAWRRRIHGFQHISPLLLRTPTVRMTTSSSSSNENEGDMFFGPFRIPSASIFHRSKLSAAFVNLRPIVPGHVLVMPQRNVPLLADLSDAEYADLWMTVRKVQHALQKHISAESKNSNANDTATEDSCAFNVAVQDGRAAGQSVPHVHVHILPRRPDDFERNDDIYDALQEWAPRNEMRQAISLDVPDDQDRRDRTPQEMAAEAASYRGFFS